VERGLLSKCCRDFNPRDIRSIDIDHSFFQRLGGGASKDKFLSKEREQQAQRGPIAAAGTMAAWGRIRNEASGDRTAAVPLLAQR
jgi:hypothetical protein